MTKASKKNLSSESVEDIAASLPSKSAKIRYLDSQGWNRAKIAKHLGIRYQHVRNVLVTLLKKDM